MATHARPEMVTQALLFFVSFCEVRNGLARSSPASATPRARPFLLALWGSWVARPSITPLLGPLATALGPPGVRPELVAVLICQNGITFPLRTVCNGNVMQVYGSRGETKNGYARARIERAPSRVERWSWKSKLVLAWLRETEHGLAGARRGP